MRPVSLSQLAAWCGARLAGADATVTAIGHDTRQLPAGALYVALRGERFDGHDFCDRAAAQGARALLVSRQVATALPQLVCADTLRALGDIAAGLAAGRPARVVGLTGSNGKTTVKTLLAAILERAAPGRAWASPGNRNNQVGLPLAVIDAPEDAAYAVYEMGAGQPGDIAYLAAIARPDVALVNNVGPAHLERLGSLLGVARTKGALYRSLPAEGVAVINADDAFAPWFESRLGPRRALRFGLAHSAEIGAEDVVRAGDGWRFRLRTPAGDAAVALPLPGRHNLANALAAAGAALAAGAGLDTIAAGLAAVEAVPGRQRVEPLADGTWLIDDSYNANPGSLAAAIALLAADGGAERWLVLGDMAELGPEAEAMHAAAGDEARAAGIHRLFTLGRLSAAASRAFAAGARHFDDLEALLTALAVARREAAVPPRILVKGSRSSAMERVVTALRGDRPAREGARCSTN